MTYVGILIIITLIKSIKILNNKVENDTTVPNNKDIKESKPSITITEDISISTKASELGELGETFTENILYKIAYENQGTKFLKNQLYILSKETSMQIDGIVILPNGTLCVIEIKNYNGIISGSENDYNWVVDYRNKSFEMINPVRQNRNHIKNLLELLKYRGIEASAISLIVFTGDRFKNNTEIENVVSINQLEHTMKIIIERNNETSATSKLIYDVLNDINRSSNFEAYKRHLQYVDSVKAQKNTKY